MSGRDCVDVQHVQNDPVDGVQRIIGADRLSEFLETKDGIESVIAAVFVEPGIWDKSKNAYKKKGALKSRMWGQVLSIINVTDTVENRATVRDKWQALKTKFTAELNKKKKPRSGDGYEP
ncbi:hypothetical protein QAD02_000425 [Eretmocerus hayati]|uniref:Uncharacterized protein n=1 Tax=Eretmocerus hayati TaxID=131215 RepID=A0ACC2NE32_9HYME|nr:hypothetical protein QAD02_000425 [Eretmocerus hayati]